MKTIDEKWAMIASTFSIILEAQQRQMDVFQKLVNFLMDEGLNNAKEPQANEKVLESA